MLDRYYFSEIDRISPEAPVPIAKIGKIENRAGGAANVALNIRKLGAEVHLLCKVGEDKEGSILKSILQKEKIQLHYRRVKRTTTKIRVLSKNQQLIRIDFDRKSRSTDLKRFEKLIRELKPQCLILSDYGKGELEESKKLIKSAKRYDTQILVDPKGSDWEKYEGADVITPNADELRSVMGDWTSDKDLKKKVAILCRKLDIKSIVLTKGEKGMSWIRKSGKIYSVSAINKEVYDVSGAGDTVIATLALARSVGFGYKKSIRIANVAAGIVVAKVGTSVVLPEELKNEKNRTK